MAFSKIIAHLRRGKVRVFNTLFVATATTCGLFPDNEVSIRNAQSPEGTLSIAFDFAAGIKGAVTFDQSQSDGVSISVSKIGYGYRKTLLLLLNQRPFNILVNNRRQKRLVWHPKL